jgi:hypothetical protein
MTRLIRRDLAASAAVGRHRRSAGRERRDFVKIAKTDPPAGQPGAPIYTVTMTISANP